MSTAAPSMRGCDWKPSQVSTAIAVESTNGASPMVGAQRCTESGRPSEASVRGALR